MPRRTRALLVLAVLAGTLLGACGNNSGPTISDPKEIVTKAFQSIQAAKSAHIEATVDGTLNPSVLGAGGAAIGDITLAGTTMSADVDIVAKNLHMTASVPAMLGLTADIIVVGADSYTKISIVGPKYTKAASGATPANDPLAELATVQAILERPDVKATKKDDIDCGSKRCYVVELDLGPDQLKTLVPGTDLGDATISGTIEVERDTLHPVVVNVAAKGSTLGDLTVKVTLSAWDRAVSISPPPADQVQ